MLCARQLGLASLEFIPQVGSRWIDYLAHERPAKYKLVLPLGEALWRAGQPSDLRVLSLLASSRTDTL